MSVQIAQHHVRIGHRRTIITQCITCRPGSGARRFGSDAQQSARIDPRQRTSPGPDFGNIYRRHLQYVTASFYEPAWSADAVSELVLGSQRWRSVENDGRFGRGPPHVENHQFFFMIDQANPRRARDTAGGAGRYGEYRSEAHTSELQSLMRTSY